MANNKNTKGGTAVAENVKAAPPAQDGKDGQAPATEAEKAKRPATTINSLSDLQKLSPDAKAALLEVAGKRANVIRGTVGQYVAEDGTVTTDKTKAKRAQGGTGRAIAVYTQPRSGDAVAVEELTRMCRLAWSVAARAKAQEAAGRRKNPLTDEELLKILREQNAPPSYLRPKASKKLYGRVLSFLRDSDEAIQAITGIKPGEGQPS